MSIELLLITAPNVNMSELILESYPSPIVLYELRYIARLGSLSLSTCFSITVARFELVGDAFAVTGRRTRWERDPDREITRCVCQRAAHNSARRTSTLWSWLVRKHMNKLSGNQFPSLHACASWRIEFIVGDNFIPLT